MEKGLCMCGCGMRTSIIKRSTPCLGYVAGEYYPYRRGHNLRGKKGEQCNGWRGGLAETLDQKKLKEQLHYNSETGVFTDLRKPTAIKGTVTFDGYIAIKVLGKSYGAHRLAWLYMKGYFPEHEVDHKDRIRTNNKFSNLREVSKSCNQRNRSVGVNNTTGVIGVCFLQKSGKYTANITRDGAQKHLGTFNTLAEAAKARYMAEIKSSYLDCDTMSSARKYIKEVSVNG